MAPLANIDSLSFAPVVKSTLLGNKHTLYRFMGGTKLWSFVTFRGTSSKSIHAIYITLNAQL
jgi:hypothetical protein